MRTFRRGAEGGLRTLVIPQQPSIVAEPSDSRTFAQSREGALKPARPLLIVSLLLGLPAACFVSQSVACHEPRTYESGVHQGYRVGMTREEAVEASTAFPFGARLFAVWASGDALDKRFPKSLAELRTDGWRNEEWLLQRGPSACLLNDNMSRLVFAEGRLRTITDELGYNGP